MKENPLETSFAKHPIVLAVTVIALTQVIPRINNAMKTWDYKLNQALLRQKFNVTTTDNFLKDEDFIARLQNDSLWRACDKITTGGDVRFWYYPPNPPVNIFEEVAIRIYQDTPFWEEAASFEYWCNIIEDDGDPENRMDHPWHTDRDEDILDKERKFVVPLMGAVFYGYNESYSGGHFHMIDAVPYKLGARKQNEGDECHKEHDMCVSNPHLFVSNSSRTALYVETKFNRLLFANVTHFHRVTKVTSGKRYSLAVNADHWKPYKVEQAPTNDEMLELAKQEFELRKGTFSLN